MENKNFKSGFISIVGRPNVGKSTLMNLMIKEKISIITDKPQTTRNKIQGIVTNENSQFIFLDTPGFHNSKNELDRFMNKTAISSIKGADVALLLMPANEFIGKNDEFLVKVFNEKDIKKILVITKIDLVDAKTLENKITEWKQTNLNVDKIIPISSASNINIQELQQAIEDFLPETGIKYFPEEAKTDQPERFIVKELIREEILLQTNDEVPHSVAILIELWEKKKSLIKISASIICESNSQKIILVGANGNMIKSIGTKSREKIEAFLGEKVFLELFVKFKPNWRKSSSLIKKMGYDKDLY